MRETQFSLMILCKKLEYHGTTSSISGNFYNFLHIITFSDFLNNCVSLILMFYHMFLMKTLINACSVKLKMHIVVVKFHVGAKKKIHKANTKAKFTTSMKARHSRHTSKLKTGFCASAHQEN